MPPNCRFEVDDIDDTWVYNQQFDYIHGRYIISFLSNPARLFQSIYEHLKPGGYVEIMETLMLYEAVDESLNGHVIYKWNKLMVDGEISRSPGFIPHILSPFASLFDVATADPNGNRRQKDWKGSALPGEYQGDGCKRRAS